MSDLHDNSESVVFGSYDPDAETEVTERNLPHWFQPGAAIFVTFRTVDSMPRQVILKWKRELEEWLRVRQLPLRLAESIVERRYADHDELLNSMESRDQGEFLRLSNRLFHRSLDDCHGACRLKDPALATIVGNAIQHYDNTKYDLDRFIVMPNHVHAIVQFRVGFTLSIVSQSWMRYSARLINAVAATSGEFWQPESFDHIIRSGEQFVYLQDYIAENPRNARLRPGESLYWQREGS